MWAPLSSSSNNPMGINWIGIVFGLAAVQSMGYWTTDFLVVQRVLSAKDIRSAKMAPIIGSFFKMAVPLIVILPGLLGRAVLPIHLVPASALQAGQHSYNEVLPLMWLVIVAPDFSGWGSPPWWRVSWPAWPERQRIGHGFDVRHLSPVPA